MLDPYPKHHYYPEQEEQEECKTCGKDFPKDELYRYPFTEDYICYDCLCVEAEKEGLTPEDYIKVYDLIS